MKVLLIKMSSMGDIIHTLPALTDAGKAIKNISFDWVVEENFQEIPTWHPLVKNVIPIALRRWRKNIFSKKTFSEIKKFKNKLRENQYDLIIDAQGLLKSAIITRFAKGNRAGLNYQSAWEPLASLVYHHKYSVDEHQHAIVRVRKLISQTLHYQMPNTIPDYGLSIPKTNQEPYLVFLHGTTWNTKHWPESYWAALAHLAVSHKMKIKLPWGNQNEKLRAERIASASSHVEVMPSLQLKEMAQVLANAQAVISVDTGLGHLAAALNVPTIALHGPTDPELTGILGARQKNLKVNFPCSPCLARECHYQAGKMHEITPPCFTTLSPELVWAELNNLLTKEV